MIRQNRFRACSFLLSFTLMISLIVTSCTSPSDKALKSTSTPAEIQSVNREIKNDTGGSISLKDGLKIELPAGSLHEDKNTLSVKRVEQLPQADISSLKNVGECYSIELDEGDFFRGPVRMDIPYDENKLPSNRSEEEIFAIYLADGVWHRLYGEVDTEKNIVSVYTIHNGFWTTAFDNAFNLAADVAIFFCGRTPVPETIEDAEQLVRLRRAEFIEIGMEAMNAVDNMEDYYPWKWAVETFQGMIVLGALEKGVEWWAGSTAVAGKLVVGGVTVGTWFALAGIGIEAYHMFVIAEETGASAALILRSRIALKRLYEAEAILYVLKHPELQTIRPEYQEALQDYYDALAVDRQITPNMPIDFNFTAYPDQTVAVPITEPKPEPIPKPEKEPQCGWTFGDEGYDDAYDILETRDGGYLIIGRVKGAEEDDFDVLLMKVNPDGTLTWDRHIGSSTDEIGESIKLDKDGGYLLYWRTYPSTKYHQTKVDEQGKQQSTDEISTIEHNIKCNDQNHISTPEGGYVRGVSLNYSQPDGRIYYEFYKFNQNDELVWRSRFDIETKEQRTYQTAIGETSDKGYVLCVSVERDIIQDILIIKTNNDGLEQWSKVISKTNSIFARSIKQTADGGYIITGFTGAPAIKDGEVYLKNTDMFLMKLNSRGEEEWFNTFGGSKYERGVSVKETSDGLYIAVGSTTSFGSGSWDVYVIVTDSKGNCLSWLK